MIKHIKEFFYLIRLHGFWYGLNHYILNRQSEKALPFSPEMECIQQKFLERQEMIADYYSQRTK